VQADADARQPAPDDREVLGERVHRRLRTGQRGTAELHLPAGLGGQQAPAGQRRALQGSADAGERRAGEAVGLVHREPLELCADGARRVEPQGLLHVRRDVVDAADAAGHEPAGRTRTDAWVGRERRCRRAEAGPSYRAIASP